MCYALVILHQHLAPLSCAVLLHSVYTWSAFLSVPPTRLIYILLSRGLRPVTFLQEAVPACMSWVFPDSLSNQTLLSRLSDT